MKPYSAYKPSGVPWLGDIPEHWGLKRLKFHVDQIGEKTSEPLAGAAYIGLEHIESGTGKFISSINGTQTESESTVSHFCVGDVLFGKLRPYLAKAVIAYGNGVCTTELLVLRPHSMDSGYLLNSLLLDGFIKTVDASTVGAKMPRADWSFIGNMLLPVPPVAEQQAIAAYLDRETARIDTLIAEKVRLIETLREYRQATISEVVTQGLDPAAPKKPSGVPWLGEIPAHWNVQRLRFRCKLNPSVKDGLSDDDVASFLPMEAVGDDGSLNLEATRLVGDVASGYTYFEDGDVTIAKITPCFENGKGAVMRGLQGGIGFGTTELIVIRPNDTVHPDWLYCLTQSDAFRKRGEAMMYGAGGQKRVPDLYVRDLPIAWPPIEEQQAIADYLASETARIDKLIAHVQDEIKLLQELRAATITDAVTGKIKVL